MTMAWPLLGCLGCPAASDDAVLAARVANSGMARPYLRFAMRVEADWFDESWADSDLFVEWVPVDAAVAVCAACEASVETGSIGPAKISGGCGSYAHVLTELIVDPAEVWYVVTVAGWVVECWCLDSAMMLRRKEGCEGKAPRDPN